MKILAPIYKIFTFEIPLNRNFGLDLLRFIAILAVLLVHSLIVIPHQHNYYKFIIDGVQVFFVLSGFLIGRILIRDFQDGITFKKISNFWKRRWFRTLPAYFFTILVIVCLYWLFDIEYSKKEVVKCLFFIQNITYRSFTFFPESWSLSIEEWFYLSLPILLFLFNRVLKLSIKVNIIVIFFVVLIFSLLFRANIYYASSIHSYDDWALSLHSPVLTRLDSLLMGVLGAWFYIYKQEFFKKKKNVLFIIGLLVFLFNKIYQESGIDVYTEFYLCVPFFSVVPFSILLMIPALYYMRPPNLYYLRQVVTIGSVISYSMYLVNLTIIGITILQPLDISFWIKYCLYWILVVLFSVLMYKYVETPFMKLRERKSNE